jgi:hypothetical protein
MAASVRPGDRGCPSAALVTVREPGSGIGGSFAMIPGRWWFHLRWYPAQGRAWDEPLAPLTALAGTLARGRA